MNNDYQVCGESWSADCGGPDLPPLPPLKPPHRKIGRRVIVALIVAGLLFLAGKFAAQVWEFASCYLRAFCH